MSNAVVGDETYPRLVERQQDAAEGDTTLIAPAYGGLSLDTAAADGVA